MLKTNWKTLPSFISYSIGLLASFSRHSINSFQSFFLVSVSETSTPDIPELVDTPVSTPGGEHGNPFWYSCLENPHGQRSLVDFSPWGRKELDTTEWLSTAPVSKYLLQRPLSYLSSHCPFIKTYTSVHSHVYTRELSEFLQFFKTQYKLGPHLLRFFLNTPGLKSAPQFPFALMVWPISLIWHMSFIGLYVTYWFLSFFYFRVHH